MTNNMNSKWICNVAPQWLCGAQGASATQLQEALALAETQVQELKQRAEEMQLHGVCLCIGVVYIDVLY